MHEDLMYEDELDAAKAAVSRLGGAKTVGSILWPEKSPEAASRSLLDALNPTRPERLNPAQVLLLMRLAREANFHGLAAYYMREAGYAPPVPLNPLSEAEVLSQRMGSMMSEMKLMADRMERMASSMAPPVGTRGH